MCKSVHFGVFGVVCYSLVQQCQAKILEGRKDTLAPSIFIEGHRPLPHSGSTPLLLTLTLHYCAVLYDS